MGRYGKLVLLIIGSLELAVQWVAAAPAILEAKIDPETSMVKLYNPSPDFLTEIENKFDKPAVEAFESALGEAEALNVQSITGADPDSMEKAILVSNALQNDEHYVLVAPLAIQKEALTRVLRSEGGAFIQIVLPGKMEPPSQSHTTTDDDTHHDGTNSETDNDDLDDETHDSDSSGEHEQNTEHLPPSYRPPGLVDPNAEPPAPTPEEARESFLQRFLRLDLSEDNKFIPETVRQALAASQQLIVNPTSYLQVPEGVTGANDQMYTITSATPVELIFGLFERRNY